jgi:hypothetical protein
MGMRTRIYIVVLLALISCGAGCTRVKPWERDILARPVMTFDAEAEENALDHGYFNAREGAAGGFDSGGGGCGCN